MGAVGVAALVLVILSPLLWDLLHRDNAVAKELRERHATRKTGSNLQDDGLDIDNIDGPYRD